MATLNEICRDLATKTAVATSKQSTRKTLTLANVLVMSPADRVNLANSLGGLVT